MTTTAPETRSPGPIPDLQPEPIGGGEKTLVAIFVVVPLLALLAAIPLAWGWGLGWHDILLAFVFYMVSGLGISAGFHRYFTHSSFKARRPLRLALAVAGSLAFEGPVLGGAVAVVLVAGLSAVVVIASSLRTRRR